MKLTPEHESEHNVFVYEGKELKEYTKEELIEIVKEMNAHYQELRQRFTDSLK